MLSVNRTT